MVHTLLHEGLGREPRIRPEGEDCWMHRYLHGRSRMAWQPRGRQEKRLRISGVAHVPNRGSGRSRASRNTEFIAKGAGLPIIKGLLTPDNAKECVARGAAAIQVSDMAAGNWTPYPRRSSPRWESSRPSGPNIPVFLDGGVRRGVHVFKALALGGRGWPSDVRLSTAWLSGAPPAFSLCSTL